ncbi:GAF domain-containing protein [Trichocoleus sp. DQ-A1]
MTLSNVGSILAALTQLTQLNRTSTLTHRVEDLTVTEFICLLDFITAEFQQYLRAIDTIGNEALEMMLDQLLEVIALKIGQILQAEHTTIFLVDRDRGQLRSKIVQGNTQKSIETSTPINVGIADHVATTGEYLNIPDASSHQLFNSELERQLGFQIRNILCMPILSSKDQVMAVVQLMNKVGNIPFDNNDEESFRDFAASIGIILESCQSFQMAARNQAGTNALLRATASLGQSRDLEATMRLVMEKARELMQVDRSTLFMLSKETDELWSKVATADGETLMEIRNPANRGIAGYVVSTGLVLNIPDAYKDTRFDPSTDQRTGYVTRNILCLPVLNSANELIGVIQLINKHQGHFTSSDEELMRAFNIQAGMALENAQVFENVRVLLEQQQSNKEFLIGADESSKRLLNLSEEDRLEGQLIADANNEQQASPVSIGISDEKQLKSTNDDAISFPSLSSLRSAHSELLKRHRESGSTTKLLAEMEEFIYRGRATGALLDTDEDRWASQSLLDYWSAILYRAGREPPDATLAEFDSALAPELDDAQCPYLGLEAFREEKSNLFYGRQRLLEKLVNHLKENRLLAVVGSSGSGKSSVVLGGLLPKLKAGGLSGSENWHYYSPMVPGVNPLENLARLSQFRDVSGTEWLQQQVESFQKDSNHLTKLSNDFGNRPSVLVVDQFEEVFTLCREDNVRQAFIDNLIGLIQSPGVRHTVILTMRTDFERQVALVPVFKDLFEQAQVRVTALDASELREAIEKPAELVGFKFEEGLVEALLQDVLGEPAALPLLQFTLLKLWDNRERNRVTWETYKRLGGGRQALARSADEFYEQLIPEEQVTVKRILLRMVRPTEGLEVTSNRIQRKTLYQAGEARDRVDRVLDKLIQARLVRLTEGDTPDDAQVEVAHEALIRNWPRLVEWLEDERINLRRRWRLAVAAEDWQARGRDKSALLRGSLLAEAQRYEDLNALEVEFIQRSVEEEEVESIQRSAEESKEALYEQASDEAYRRLQRVIQEIDAKLQELSASQQNHLIETITQIGMQEQLDALTQFQLELEQGKEVADWLEQHIDSLTQMIGQEALNAYPKIRDAATAKQIRIFYLSIRQFIERLIHCLKWGRTGSLETPETPVVLEEKLYKAAFEKLKTIQPERLPKEGIEQLEDYINYLLESLPTYQHLSLD